MYLLFVIKVVAFPLSGIKIISRKFINYEKEINCIVGFCFGFNAGGYTCRGIGADDWWSNW